MKSQMCFERMEQKYRLDKGQKEHFLRMVQERIHPDQYGYHTIHNIYYDTDQYDLIRQSIEKPKYKEKFRIRGYGRVTGESPVFLEIKKKYRGVVYKRRTELTAGETSEFLKEGRMPGKAGQIGREIDYFFSFYHPQPKVYLAYDRTAYAGNDNPELRITIDENIRSKSLVNRTRELWELAKEDMIHPNEEVMLDPEHFIMEIKVPGAYPVWLAKILSELCIYPVSFSKYGNVYKSTVQKSIVQRPSLAYEEERSEVKGEEICLPVY